MDKQGGHSYKPDIDWNTAGNFKGSQNAPRRETIANKLGLLEYLSHLQIISIQEKNIVNKLDKDIFTVGQSINGFNIGLKTGAGMSVLSIIYILCFFIFSVDEPRFSKMQDYIFVNSLTIVVMLVSMWLGFYSKYVVGPITKKMMISLYSGKMIASIGVGIAILIGLSWMESNISSYASLFDSSGYLGGLNVNLEKFLANYNVMYATVIVQMVFSSFLAFVMLQFRHLFISGDRVKDYENY